MGLNLSSANIALSLSIVLIMLFLITSFLRSKNKALREKLILEKRKFYFYKDNIKNLRYSEENPKEALRKLNGYFRSFLKEYFSLNDNLTYLELKKIFTDKNMEDYAKLCRNLSDMNYSGNPANIQDIKKLIQDFYEILEVFEESKQ